MEARRILEVTRDAFDVSRGRARYATIRERIIAAARIDGIHLCQLISAMLIASIGLNINSTEAVIGAMLICPLMGSALALAYAIATMDMHVLRHAAGGLVLQMGICLITSTLYFLISPIAAETSELLTNSSATIWDVLIALVGGFAGALGFSRRQEPQTLLAGVAVATALMPPLCSTGYGLATGNLMLALAALYEFLVNMVFIAFGATLVLVLLHMPLRGDLDGDGRVTQEELAEVDHDSRLLRHRLIAALVVFAIPCLYFSAQTVRRSVEQNGTVFEVEDSYDTEMVTKELDVVLPGLVDYRVGVEDAYDEATDTVEQRVVATVETQAKLTDAQQRRVRSLIVIHVPKLDEVEFEVREQPDGPDAG